MMTNLLSFAGSVLVSVVTNVTEVPTDFERYEPIPCPDGSPGCLVYHSRGVNPQGRLVIATVKEVRTLSFEWEGEPRAVTQERVLRTETKHFKREWVESPPAPRTNAAPCWITNGVIQWGACK